MKKECIIILLFCKDELAFGTLVDRMRVKKFTLGTKLYRDLSRKNKFSTLNLIDSRRIKL